MDPASSRELRVDYWKRAHLKGTSKIRRLLERLVEYRKGHLVIPDAGLVYLDVGVRGQTLALSASEVKAVYRRALSAGPPLESVREAVKQRLKDQLVGKYAQSVGDEFPKESRDEREKRLRTDLNSLWHGIDTRHDYYSLLASSELLRQLGKGILTEEDVRLLSSSVPEEGTVDLEDIPALCYLHVLGYGTGGERYDHIVVDEAQDFSPLQFELLRLYSRHDSMTIIGDIAQGIYAHRGISRWDEIMSLFTSETLQYEEIIQSYRPTREIVLFTNEVLRRLRQGENIVAQPLNRPGDKPRIIEASSREVMYAAVVDDVRSLLANRIKHIGIIAKTDRECNQVRDFLAENGLSVSQAISSRDAEFDDKSSITVLPVTLAKGIEFQAVLVMNASEAEYDGHVQYDGRLLYVAMTRALHHLYIYSLGAVSSFLDAAKSNAILETR
jgi:DNA helicase-2/ATP-dependent DNA helicase PcrA